ncbi:DUF342 domain-containing protein [Aquibacillus kalidii]|uniref:DUF342 domain-containing protein n=1 Tax=Aquibacillus kalidii TaxID=2762597 RepID=UPI00164437D1|nr:FapA family protein [Aquibacillus kalidii]
MEALQNTISVEITKGAMEADFCFKEAYGPEMLNIEDLKKLLVDKGIVFGIQENVLNDLLLNGTDENKSYTVAVGKDPENGADGSIHFYHEQSIYMELEEKRTFRDVIKIPSVMINDKIAKIIPPTEGMAGTNIYGKPVKQKVGKPVKIKAGKNVDFSQSDNTFYARADGQLSIGEKSIHVQPNFEVNGDLSLKTGNLDFVGSITIRGNVPTGYSVKAQGDITVHGLVESAYLEAGGSIYISEGISGMKKATLIASLDVKAAYVNQAIIEAGRDIIVKNSILHSHCVAQENIFCQSGNIIGGMSSAGKMIEAKDIGNNMNTNTDLSFGINNKVKAREKELYARKKEQTENISKLRQLGNSLMVKEKSSSLSTKERILLLKQRNMLEKTIKQLEEIEEELGELQVTIGNLEGMKLVAKGVLHPNVHITFDKYTKSITTNYHFTQVYLKDSEIEIHSL